MPSRGAFATNIKEIQNMAGTMGVKFQSKIKVLLIREIQRAEGNFDCLGSAGGYCDQLLCSFYADCLNENAASDATGLKKAKL